MLLLPALLAGCGIRSTEVPTDFGPAPSRASCALSGPQVQPRSGGVPERLFLVCTSQLVTVDRTVPLTGPDSDAALPVARALLAELAARPPVQERRAGYTTDVPDGISVTGPRGGDPAEALRLATPPEDLGSYALAQLVCTLAGSAASDGKGGVVLGGPGEEPLRRYSCPAELRSRPGSTAPPSTKVTF
ncbi:hypothetical protein [Streptomyces sp. NPDC058045]|uniref:hypothetical protein n=1 Tax=Streptomyces sp. NPDC058045 TaxID=3346311 RepID=UPI0036F04E84